MAGWFFYKEAKLSKSSFIYFAIVILLTGCGKSTSASGEDHSSPPQDIAQHAHGTAILNKDKKSVPIVVPAQVNKKWHSVVITVTNKAKNSEADYKFKSGSQGNTINGTNMALEIKEFLPHFVMDGKGITSASNELKNPALRAVITENGKVIYSGWIFKKHPSVPLFMHDKIDIKLKGTGGG